MPTQDSTANTIKTGLPGQRKQFRMVLCSLLIVLLLSSLDSTILNTSLPIIARELGSLSKLSWVVSSFMPTSTVSTLLYGKLADRYGAKHAICSAIVLFLIGSALSGSSHTIDQLVLYRGLQGIGAGGLIALAQTLIAIEVGPERRSYYQGFFSSTIAVSNIAGPLVGGALTYYLSWRWIFYINIPLGLIAIFLLRINLEKSHYNSGTIINYTGMMYFSFSVIPLFLWMTFAGERFDWLSRESVLFAFSSLVFGTIFLKRELSSEHSFLGLHLLGDRTFLAASSAAVWLGFATMGVNVYTPVWFQVVHGMNPIEAGLMILPRIVAMILSSVLGPRILLRRYSYRGVISLGLALEVLAVSGLALACHVRSSPVMFGLFLAMMGSGMGIAWPNIITTLQSQVGRRDLGTATATLTFTRAFGSTLGVAVAGAMVNAWVGATATTDTLFPRHGQRPLAPGVAAAYQQVLGASFLLFALAMMAAFQSIWLLLPSREPGHGDQLRAPKRNSKM